MTAREGRISFRCLDVIKPPVRHQYTMQATLDAIGRHSINMKVYSRDYCTLIVNDMKHGGLNTRRCACCHCVPAPRTDETAYTLG